MSLDTVLTLKHWGNNLGVRLPAAVAKAAQLHVEQRVRISVEAGRVVMHLLGFAIYGWAKWPSSRLPPGSHFLRKSA